MGQQHAANSAMNGSRPRRLHPVAWLVLLVAASMMLILIAPGLPTDGEPVLQFPPVVDRKVDGRSVSDGPPQHVREYAHGWPLTFMRRAFGYAERRSVIWPQLPRTPGTRRKIKIGPVNTLLVEPGRPVWGGLSLGDHEIAWTSPQAWPVTRGDIWEFLPLALLADLALGVAVVVLATAGCQRWIKRRGAFWRWRLIDLAVLTAVVATVLGGWRAYDSGHASDAKLLQTPLSQEEIRQLTAKGALTPLTSREVRMNARRWRISWAYRGPEWLARFVGGRTPLDRFSRIVQTSRSSNSKHSWEDVARLSALESLTILDDPPSERESNGITRLTKLRELTWHEPSAEVLRWLPCLNHLEQIVLVNCLASDAEIERLRQRMPSVRVELEDTLYFRGR